VFGFSQVLFRFIPLKISRPGSVIGENRCKIESKLKKLPFEDQIEESEQEHKKEKNKVEYYREKPKKKHPGRADFPDHLPVEEVWIEPEQSTEGMKLIGYETKKELDYQPGKMYVRKFIRPKYEDPVKETVLIGDLPFRPIDKGIAGPGLLAQLFVDKYVLF
jgi:hypothetical protein